MSLKIISTQIIRYKQHLVPFVTKFRDLKHRMDFTPNPVKNTVSNIHPLAAQKINGCFMGATDKKKALLLFNLNKISCLI